MDVASMFFANANSPLASVKLSRNNCLLSLKECCNNDYNTSTRRPLKRNGGMYGGRGYLAV
jgi:hypothetical protein